MNNFRILSFLQNSTILSNLCKIFNSIYHYFLINDIKIFASILFHDSFVQLNHLYIYYIALFSDTFVIILDYT